MRKRIAALLLAVFSVGGVLLASNAASAYQGIWVHGNAGMMTHVRSPFYVQGRVTDIKQVNHYRFILTDQGAVYAPDGGYHGGANGQAYFRGRTAASIWPCTWWNGRDIVVSGYTIRATSGEQYNYGVANCNYR